MKTIIAFNNKARWPKDSVALTVKIIILGDPSAPSAEVVLLCKVACAVLKIKVKELEKRSIDLRDDT